MHRFLSLLAIAAAFLLPAAALAQTASAPAPNTTPPAPIPSIPRVESVTVAESPTPADELPSAELGDTLNIQLSHLQEWAAQIPDKNADPSDRDPRKLTLSLDGYTLKGVSVVAVKDDVVSFRLRRTSDNRDTWEALFARSRASYGVTDGIEVRVGQPGKPPFPAATSNPPKLRLILYKPATFLLSTVGFSSLLIIFIILATKSGILRDGDGAIPKLQKPYSLGRFQMALWFFTILGSFIFLRIATKDWDVIPDQALALFGISLATGVSAAVIDTSKRASAENELTELQKTAAPTPQQTTRMTTLTKQIQGPTTVNFLVDILSDGDGISFHRFQMAAWTLVLWIMFVISVFSTLAMPEFSNQLLGLLGLSGGTYLGFKFPEQKA